MPVCLTIRSKFFLKVLLIRGSKLNRIGAYGTYTVVRRVARIWKRGGYFERVRSVQTTLTRIFIDLESVSDGLSEIWDEKSRKNRKFKGFFRPKLGDPQKKKKKKKRSSPKFEVIFQPKFEIQSFFSAQN